MRCTAIVSLPYVVKMQENDVNASRIAFLAGVVARCPDGLFYKTDIKQIFILDRFGVVRLKIPSRKM
jgi:hypothetical protein